MVNRTAALGANRAVRASAVVELRQYTLHPGQRDALLELFEEELLAPQEQAGMTVIGQFADRDFPDRFVWLRGFRDMRARRDGLESFYDGPVWKAHRDAANATIIDSDDVLLLRPARPDAAFELDADRPRIGADPGARGAVAAAILYLERDDAQPVALRAFEATVAPAITGAGGAVLGYFVTEPSPNDFPRLPVRDGERVLVWFAGFAEPSALAVGVERMRGAVRAASVRRQAIRRIEYLRLAPTARSLLSGRTAACRAAQGKISRASDSGRSEGAA